jgi:phosphate uptake regulator
MLIERNLQSIGKSLLVTLPKEWTKTFGLKKGSRIKMIVTEQGQLLIAPEFTKKEQNRSSSIEFSATLERRFYREYFGGSSSITIMAGKPLSEAERKRIAALVSKFINVQVIDEKSTSVKMKVFRIDELTVEECLQRMHYLSLTMIEELKTERNVSRIEETEQNITKFYYLLVMLIRQYLSEGKFVGEQLPLIRAMDYRMAAEKIERIADIAKELQLENPHYQLLNDVEEHYRKAFSAFLHQNFEKAEQLWTQERAIIERHKKLLATKSVQQYKITRALFDMLSYSKQISSLTR